MKEPRGFKPKSLPQFFIEMSDALSFYFPLKNKQRGKGLVTSLGLEKPGAQVGGVELNPSWVSNNYTSQSAPAAASWLLVT